MDIRKVIIALLASEPSTATEFRKVIADALGDESQAFFNLSIAELWFLASSVKVGDILSFAVEQQGI